MQDNKKCRNAILWWMVAGGTLVRLVYGFASHAWTAAPDQIAWGLGIEDMLRGDNWSLKQLMHAPHEGGGLLLGLLSIPFRPLAFIMPPLSFAALIVDIAGRWIQLWIVNRFFGKRLTIWFGVWGIAAVPSLLPWATVNFGLHALLAFIPFVFYGLLVKYHRSSKLPMIAGIASGIAASLVYDSLVLVPVCLLVLGTRYRAMKWRDIALYSGWLAISLLPHIAMRISLSGHEGHDTLLSIRGYAWEQWSGAFTPLHLLTVWFTSLPGSFMLAAGWSSPLFVCVWVCGFLLAGYAFYCLSERSYQHRSIALSIVIVYLLVYAGSPFYGNSYRSESYVYYRHLGFILPFAVMIMVNGLLHINRAGVMITAAWLFICGFSVLRYISSAKPAAQTAWRPAGWIMAQKYTDISTLVRIGVMLPADQRDELVKGYGWGLAAKCLKNQHDPEAVKCLLQLARQFPVSQQHTVLEGTRYAFTKGITPVLDTALLPFITQATNPTLINH